MTERNAMEAAPTYFSRSLPRSLRLYVMSSENTLYSRIDASDGKMSKNTFYAKLNDNHFLSQAFLNISNNF